MAATPAIAALEAAGVDFSVTEYDAPARDESYGDVVVATLGLDPLTVGKSLVAVLDGSPVVAVVPVAGSLDLKALARAGGGKRAEMAAQADAERWTGSVVGGIAPLGHRTSMAVFVDELLCVGDEVHVSGGRRGLEVTLTPSALVSVCGAVVAPIAR